MEKNKVRVEIFGIGYLLKGDGPPSYIEEIAAYVDRKMREIAEKTKMLSPLRIAILAALNISEEMHRLKKGKKIAPDLGGGVAELIEKIEEELK